MNIRINTFGFILAHTDLQYPISYLVGIDSDKFNRIEILLLHFRPAISALGLYFYPSASDFVVTLGFVLTWVNAGFSIFRWPPTGPGALLIGSS